LLAVSKLPIINENELFFFDRKVEESLSLTANLKQTFREVEWLKQS